ncbi:MAG TPA: SAM-dependent methyltransferase [Blastocatellia bacterium]|jgi:SAM-dependent MidA family methyltransferase
MTSEATSLERKLIARIEHEGALTFRDFMHAALYDAEHGYYNTERLKIGPQGDYYTSSNVHPAFGAVLARAFAEMWNGLPTRAGQPFTIVEMGAGTGQLASDILTAMRDERPAIFDHLSYVIIEVSPAMLARQREKLSGFDERIQWRRLEEIEGQPVAGIFFSNELVDAMPVHRVRFTGGRIEELFVTASPASGMNKEARLALKWGQPSTEKLQEYVERAVKHLTEGQILEINLDATRWLARISQAIKRGFLVTIDYGDLASHLYGPGRAGGTLRSFYKHRLIDSPLERAGEQDITSSVNFTALIDYGRDFGFETVSYERQTAFLIRFGLIERIAAMHDASGSVDDLKERLAVKNLFVPGGVSDNFRVLIQKRLNDI